MIGLHCDAEDCVTWQRAGVATHWITVENARTATLHFCTSECLTRWAVANSMASELS